MVDTDWPAPSRRLRSVGAVFWTDRGRHTGRLAWPASVRTTVQTTAKGILIYRTPLGKNTAEFHFVDVQFVLFLNASLLPGL